MLVAISVDPPEKTRAMLAGRAEAGEALTFPVLCDPTRAAVEAYGVHDRAHDIALPATVILDRQGRVAWKYVGESIVDRPDEAAVLEALRALAARPAG